MTTDGKSDKVNKWWPLLLLLFHPNHISIQLIVVLEWQRAIISVRTRLADALAFWRRAQLRYRPISVDCSGSKLKYDYWWYIAPFIPFLNYSLGCRGGVESSPAWSSVDLAKSTVRLNASVHQSRFLVCWMIPALTFWITVVVVAVSFW